MSISHFICANEIKNITFSETNHGQSIDLPTITLTLGGIFFGIPVAYKRVRDALSGWKEISCDIIDVIDKIRESYKIAGLSDNVLFIKSIDYIVQKWNLDGSNLIFINMFDIPVEQCGFDNEINKNLIFTFLLDNNIFQISINEKGDELWSNKFCVIP